MSNILLLEQKVYLDSSQIINIINNTYNYRFLWFLVVMVAVLLFVGQVGMRVAVYFQYKSNVAVKVNYVDQIEFPSVTICNQNNYRYGFIHNLSHY